MTRHLSDEDIVWPSLRFLIDGNTVTIFVETTVSEAEEIVLRLYPRHPFLFRFVVGLPDKSKFVKNFIRKRLEGAINAAPN